MTKVGEPVVFPAVDTSDDAVLFDTSSASTACFPFRWVVWDLVFGALLIACVTEPRAVARALGFRRIRAVDFACSFAVARLAARHRALDARLSSLRLAEVGCARSAVGPVVSGGAGALTGVGCSGNELAVSMVVTQTSIVRGALAAAGSANESRAARACGAVGCAVVGANSTSGTNLVARVNRALVFARVSDHTRVAVADRGVSALQDTCSGVVARLVVHIGARVLARGAVPNVSVGARRNFATVLADAFPVLKNTVSTRPAHFPGAIDRAGDIAG